MIAESEKTKRGTDIKKTVFGKRKSFRVVSLPNMKKREGSVIILHGEKGGK